MHVRESLDSVQVRLPVEERPRSPWIRAAVVAGVTVVDGGLIALTVWTLPAGLWAWLFLVAAVSLGGWAWGWLASRQVQLEVDKAVLRLGDERIGLAELVEIDAYARTDCHGFQLVLRTRRGSRVLMIPGSVSRAELSWLVDFLRERVAALQQREGPVPEELERLRH